MPCRWADLPFTTNRVDKLPLQQQVCRPASSACCSPRLREHLSRAVPGTRRARAPALFCSSLSSMPYISGLISLDPQVLGGRHHQHQRPHQHQRSSQQTHRRVLLIRAGARAALASPIYNESEFWRGSRFSRFYRPTGGRRAPVKRKIAPSAPTAAQHFPVVGAYPIR